MSKIILQAASVHKSYQMGAVALRVLRGVSLSITEGEFMGVTGISGSGKSTLLHLLGALDIPDRGEISFEGRNMFAGPSARRDRLRNRTFGFVFQFYHLLPELTVLENTLLPCMVSHTILGWYSRRSRIRKDTADLLNRLGLGQRLGHRPNELSGGERQRVAIARALANKPKVLLADEPTGNLDVETGREILEVLKTLNNEGQTIVMVTHDPQVAASAHRIVSLVDGKITKQ